MNGCIDSLFQQDDDDDLYTHSASTGHREGLALSQRLLTLLPDSSKAPTTKTEHEIATFGAQISGEGNRAKVEKKEDAKRREKKNEKKEI